MSQCFPKLVTRLNEGMAAGLHIGAVVYVQHDGAAVADFAIGRAALTGHQPQRTHQKMLWLSAGKPLTALAVGLLRDNGALDFDAPVASIIPEFAQNGKDGITIRHLLMQAHGYKPPRTDWPRQPRERVIETICEAPLVRGAAPGQFAAYDPQSGWYLLSEIVARVSGVPNHIFVKKELLDPLHCASASIGLDPDVWRREREAGELAVLHDTTHSARERLDLREEALPDLPPGERPPAPVPNPWPGDDGQRAGVHNPGGGALGHPRDLARIYQCLLDEGATPDSRALLQPATVHEMTSRQRKGLKDHTFKQVVDWGLGFLVNSGRYGAGPHPYGYGQHASDATFGHGGMQSSAGFADPENRLCGTIIFNGLPGEPRHDKRIDDAMTALYEDLGIA